MDFSNGGDEAGSGDMNAQLGALVLQMLHQQTQKTCFKKCFIQPGAKFVDVLGKSEHVCLAKCMDRMYESYAIVTKASTDMAQNMSTTDAAGGPSYSFQ
jgi:import inner membrane translocase subunit TIM13